MKKFKKGLLVAIASLSICAMGGCNKKDKQKNDEQQQQQGRRRLGSGEHHALRRRARHLRRRHPHVVRRGLRLRRQVGRRRPQDHHCASITRIERKRITWNANSPTKRPNSRTSRGPSCARRSAPATASAPTIFRNSTAPTSASAIRGGTPPSGENGEKNRNFCRTKIARRKKWQTSGMF